MGNYTYRNDFDFVAYHFNENGRYHRLDGPAVEFKDGYHRWFINGVEIWSEEEFNKHPLVIEYRIIKLINEALSE